MGSAPEDTNINNLMYEFNKMRHSDSFSRSCKNSRESIDDENCRKCVRADELQPRYRNNARSSHFWHQFLNAELEDMKSAHFWRSCVTEFIATFLLCFYHIGILMFMPDDGPPPLLHISVGHGLYVAAVVTALGATGGCHMNPAVTLTFFTLQEIRIVRAVFYVFCQCAGAITGAVLLEEVSDIRMVGNLGVISPGADISVKQVICTEIVITTFLLIVVVATSDKKRTDIQGLAPLIVGLTVTVNTLLANKVSGSCMNPARALGPAVVMGDYNNLGIYWLAPCCGALIGGHLYRHCLAPTSGSSLACCQGSKSKRQNIKTQLLFDTMQETDL